MKLTIINGPNLNLLGSREKSIYGSSSLTEIETSLKNEYSKKIQLNFFQSNHEGDIIDFIQKQKEIDGIVINAGAFTHSSIAIRDALAAINVAFIEVHISNIYKRENFRQHSYLSDLAIAVIAGLGVKGYNAAIEYFISQ